MSINQITLIRTFLLIAEKVAKVTGAKHQDGSRTVPNEFDDYGLFSKGEYTETMGYITTGFDENVGLISQQGLIQYGMLFAC